MIYQAYFIGSPSFPYVKIGRGNVEQRVYHLQIGCPYQLSILGATNEFGELELHKRFAHLRVTGEWFNPDKELSKLIFNCDYIPPSHIYYSECDYQWAIKYSMTDGSGMRAGTYWTADWYEPFLEA